jgi:hypothetical protein
VALLGFGIGKHFALEAGIRTPSWALIASGLLMALSGIFQGDFENRPPPRVWRRSVQWRPLTWPALALLLGSIVTGFLRVGEAPGLGQRLGFGCFFLWVAVVGYGLYRNADQPARGTGHAA